MENAPRQALADRARPVFGKYPAVQLALLFGSMARGTDNERSDVDIAVSGRGIDLPLLASDLSLALGREVDLVTIDSDPSIPLLRELLDDAICLYEAERGAYAALHIRALWAMETDGPVIDKLAHAYLAHLAGSRPHDPT